MRFLASLLIAFLLPLGAAAQDTLSYVPEDRNCSDFDSRLNAQGWFLAVQQLSGERDAHGLDRDGDGIACSGIQTIRVDSLNQDSDSLNLTDTWFETRERVRQISCHDTTFTMQAYERATREGLQGEGVHTEWTKMNQCLELWLVVRQNQ